MKLEDEVALRFYRLQKISEGKIDLEQGEAEPLKVPTEFGTGGFSEEPEVYLSSLIDQFNERLGTEFTKADQLFLDQVAEAVVADEKLKQAAKANTLDNFKSVFERLVEGLFVDRLDGNEEIVDRVLNDQAFRRVASDLLMQEVYERLRRGAAN